MPTLRDNQKKSSEMMEKGLLVPIATPAPPQGLPPIPAYPAAPNSFLRTPLPTLSVQQPDQQRQWQTGATPQARISPQSPTGNAVMGAQSVSQTIVQVGGGGGGPLLETNNQKNAVQSVLNLIPESGMAISSDSQGGVHFSATATGDDLIHGDAIWEIDPAFFCIRDDFSMAPVTFPLADFDSEFPWHGINGGAGNFQSAVWPGQGFSGNVPSFGFVMMLNNSTANNASWLCPRTDTATFPQIGWPILDYPGWKLIWIFTVERQFHGSVPAAFTFAQTSLYVGAGNWPGIVGQPIISTTPRPLDFIGLRYDTDTTSPAISDTTFMFEQVFQTPNSSAPARNNTQGQTFNTGITPTEGVAYRFEMSCGTGGQVLLSLSNGLTTATKTFAISPLSGLSVTNGSFSGYGLYTTSGGASFPWVPGTKVTNGAGVVTLMPAILQPSNGAWLLSQGGTSGTVSFFPALLPFAAFGNDSQATPTGSSKGIGIDYFGFLWNPSVNGGSGTPNSQRSRYF